MIQVQNSYVENDKGSLYIVPTPIGNLEDITFRALKTLEQVALIAAEDTRHTQKLLNHFEIKNDLLSYNEHNHEQRVEQIMEKLLNKEDVALVSDAGMPAISDPGYELVQAAIKQAINIVVLPGANAALCALVGSGLATNEFLFAGFLPRKKKDKLEKLKALGNRKATVILYESPYRVKDTLKAIDEQLGNRQLAIAREITKMYEQFIRGKVEDVLEWLEENEIKGECCIVMEGSDETIENDDWWQSLSLEEHVLAYEEKENLSHKAAMKKVATDRGISRRDVYQAIHVN